MDQEFLEIIVMVFMFVMLFGGVFLLDYIMEKKSKEHKEHEAA